MKAQILTSILLLSIVIFLAPVVQAGTDYQVLQATLTQQVRSPGLVRIGMTQWRCRGTRCSTKVRSNINLMNACVSLARKVGSVRSFGVAQPASRKGKTTSPLNKTITSRTMNAAGVKRFANVLSCNQAAANTGKDMLTTHLQSEIQSRSQDITVGTQMMKNTNDSRAPILRNIR